MQVEQVKKRAYDGVQGASKVPLYRQISDTLLAGIREGKFPVGTFLPGELELIDRPRAHLRLREGFRLLCQSLEDLGVRKARLHRKGIDACEWW